MSYTKLFLDEKFYNRGDFPADQLPERILKRIPSRVKEGKTRFEFLAVETFNKVPTGAQGVRKLRFRGDTVFQTQNPWGWGDAPVINNIPEWWNKNQ